MNARVEGAVTAQHLFAPHQSGPLDAGAFQSDLELTEKEFIVRSDKDRGIRVGTEVRLGKIGIRLEAELPPLLVRSAEMDTEDGLPRRNSRKVLRPEALRRISEDGQWAQG